jgi:NDP-sugar pyrophosphorylase family protein
VVTNAEKKILRFIEKPDEEAPSHWINAGAYILERSIIMQIPAGENVSIERQVFPTLLKNNQPLYGYMLKGYWNDIGTPQSYIAAHRDLLGGGNNWTRASNFRKRAVLVGAGSRVHSSVTLGGFVSIGRNCRIDEGATIADSVLLDGVVISKHARISGAILGSRCKIGSFAEIKEGAVVGDNSTLSDHSKC